jgi:hypothetical protein
LTLGFGVGAVNVVSLCYSNQKSIAGGDEIMLRNLMVRGYFSAIAASFNPSIERTSPGKPGAASHLKR